MAPGTPSTSSRHLTAPPPRSFLLDPRTPRSILAFLEALNERAIPRWHQELLHERTKPCPHHKRIRPHRSSQPIARSQLEQIANVLRHEHALHPQEQLISPGAEVLTVVTEKLSCVGTLEEIAPQMLLP